MVKWKIKPPGIGTALALSALLACSSCAQQGKTQTQRPPSCKLELWNGYLDAPANAVSECRTMSLAGDVVATRKLAKYLEENNRNRSEALDLYRRAADMGDTVSMRRLFDAYLLGQLVTKNEALADEYLLKAAEAKADWAVLLLASRNESIDPQGSLQTYIQLARAGHCFAQAKLAHVYHVGDLASKNPTQSYFWGLLVNAGGTGRTSDYHHRTHLIKGSWATMCAQLQNDIPKVERELPAESRQLAQNAASNWVVGGQEPLLPPPLGAVSGPPTKVAALRQGNMDSKAVLPPPRIDIQTSISTEVATASIVGRIVSASGAATLMIDGVPIPVSFDGRFRIDKPVSIGESKLKLVAMDAMGQRSETVATVTRTTPAETGPSYPPLVPTAVKGIRNGDAVALIVGIEGYESAPKAAYAEQDARVFYDYAVNVLGIPADNVKLLVGKGARRLDIEKTLATWVPPRVSSGKTDVVVFFAGHGLASDDGKELFLLPHDGDRDVLAESAVRRSRIVDGLKSAGVRRVTLLLDTCYSGSTREGEALLANARPVALVAKEGDLPDGVTMISAAQGDQISLSLKEAGHGLFSYTLMKGLEGAADADGDRKITAAELHAFVSDRVAREASRSGRRQTPMLVGDGGQVLARW